MKLSDNFTLEEFTTSQTATREGISNLPSSEIIQSLKVTALGMEEVRTLLGFPISISSGYRCLALNKRVKGATTSQHLYGEACDFICPQFGSPLLVAMAIAKSNIKFDQLIMEGTWVHISFSTKNRREVLTAKFVNGKAQYSKGL